MSKLFEDEIKNMQRLINFGNVNESKNNNSNRGVVEYHTVGADGKTYGIIKECSKYYIKVAPKKDTEVLVEDYDYIGGFNNKKENEFLTYSNAAKQFDFKMKSLNEAYSKKDTVERFQPTKPAEWQINETKEMRDEINRYNQIVNNVSNILNENKGGDPFTETTKYEGDKDQKHEEKDPKKAGFPFDKEKGEKDDNGGDPYKEKPGKTEDLDECGLACEPGKDTGKKPVRYDESRKRKVKLTEEQVLAWSKSKDFMDKTRGTHIGSSSPYTEEADDNGLNDKAQTEPLHEHDTAVHNTDSQDKPEPGTNKPGDSYPYDDEKEKIYEVEIDMDDTDPNADMTDDEFKNLEQQDYDYEHGDDDEFIEDEPDYDELKDLEDKTGSIYQNQDKDALNKELFKGVGSYADDDDFYGDDDFDFYESRKRRGRAMNEMVLNDFGKHPAYQKKVMTLPPNVEIDKFGRDWNDESAKGEKPYGTKIGSSFPYSEKLVDKITDLVMNEMYNKKKV